MHRLSDDNSTSSTDKEPLSTKRGIFVLTNPYNSHLRTKRGCFCAKKEKSEDFLKKVKKIFGGFKKMRTFASAFEKNA
jgi:hypothetical protein